MSQTPKRLPYCERRRPAILVREAASDLQCSEAQILNLIGQEKIGVCHIAVGRKVNGHRERISYVISEHVAALMKRKQLGEINPPQREIPMAKRFGARLRLCRGELSQAEFARILGLPNQATYHRYEAGRIPKLETLCGLARRLGISLDQILGNVPLKSVRKNSAPSRDCRLQSAKAMLRSCGLSYRKAAPFLGAVTYQHVSEGLNGRRESERLLQRIAALTPADLGEAPKKEAHITLKLRRAK